MMQTEDRAQGGHDKLSYSSYTLGRMQETVNGELTKGADGGFCNVGKDFSI